MIVENRTNLRGDFLNYGVVHLSMDEGAVCLDDDVIILAVLHNIALLVERVELDKCRVSYAQDLRN